MNRRMEIDDITELDDSLDDIEPVSSPPELYEHFRVTVDKGQAPVRRYASTNTCLNGLSTHRATVSKRLQITDTSWQTGNP